MVLLRQIWIFMINIMVILLGILMHLHGKIWHKVLEDWLNSVACFW